MSERDPTSKVRTLHRNLLLPCDNLPFENLETTQRKNCPNQRKQQCLVPYVSNEKAANSEPESDDEPSFILEQEPTPNVAGRPPTPYRVSEREETSSSAGCARNPTGQDHVAARLPRMIYGCLAV